MKRMTIAALAWLLALGSFAAAQTTTLTIDSGTGLVNVPTGVTPNFATLHIGGVTLGSLYQPLNSNLTTYAGIAPSGNVQTLLAASNFMGFKMSLALENVDNTSDATKNAATATIANKTLDATNTVSPGVTMMPNIILVNGDSRTCAGMLYFPPGFVGQNNSALGNPLTGIPNSYNAVASYTGGEPGAITGSYSVSYTSGSPNITLTSGTTAGLKLGQRLDDNGTVYHSTVASISDATHIVGAANAAATATGTLSYSPNPNDATGLKPVTSWGEQLTTIPGAPTLLYDEGQAGRYTTDCYNKALNEMLPIAPAYTGVPKAYAFQCSVNDFSQATTAGTLVADIVQMAKWAHQYGFYPFIVCTEPVCSFFNAGSDWDNKRMAYNTLLRANTGQGLPIDALADLENDSQLASSLNATTGVYTRLHPENYIGANDAHCSAAGNTHIAADVFAALKSALLIPSTTQKPAATDYLTRSANELAPWSRQHFTTQTINGNPSDPYRRLVDFTQNHSGADAQVWPYGGAHVMGVAAGTGATDWLKLSTGAIAFGGKPAYGSIPGNVTPAHGNGFAIWPRPCLVEFGIATGFTLDPVGTNAYWQILYGRTEGDNNPPVAVANTDVVMGLKITSTVAGQINIYAVASDGTTANATFLATISDNVYHTFQLYSDGNGYYTVTIDDVPYPVGRVLNYNYQTNGGCRLTVETINSGTLSSPYCFLYVSDFDISWK